ncbi:MAG: trypsin-like peptidase domain-containing protein [Oscillospiraceae bacterium]|nr:trypsin-like peptidase domain-containing protein [Oscillospiraceae bacterium]
MQDWRDDYGGGRYSGRRAPNTAAGLALAMLCGALAGGGVAYALGFTRTRTEGERAGAGGVVTIQVAPPVDASMSGADGALEQGYGVERIARAASPSVLEITTNSKAVHPFYGSYVISGAGSAVALTEDGYLITNNHVIKDATTIRARASTGDEYTAAVIGTDSQTDIAVLKIDARGLIPVVFADSDEARVGELTVAIGNPLGTLGGTVTEGVLSAKDRAIVIDGQTMTLLQTSAAINPGNSGGGLFDGAGRLVGIVVAKANESNGTQVEGIGYAIPSNIVRRVASELAEHGYVTGRPALGIVAKVINSRYDLIRYQLDRAGVYVMNAFNDSPVMLWDQILTVNGQPIAGAEDVQAAIEGAEIGGSVPVEVRRQGRNITLDVLIREKTPEMVDADMV